MKFAKISGIADLPSGIPSDAQTVNDIVTHIFYSCDIQKCGTVETNTLIKYVQSYLQEDTVALEKLEKALDPVCTNAALNFDTFSCRMKEWISTISETSGQSHNITPRDLQRLIEMDSNVVHSTPNSTTFNLSACSTYSRIDGEADSRVNNSILEQKHFDLKRQNERLIDELYQLKLELAEVLNERGALASQISKFKNVINEPKTNRVNVSVEEVAKKESIETNYLEKVNMLMEMDKMKISDKQLELKKSELTAEIRILQNENESLDRDKNFVTKKYEEAVQHVTELEMEIYRKKVNLQEMEKVREELQNKNSELENIVDSYMCTVDKLSYEKEAIEKVLKKSGSSSNSKTNEGSPALVQLIRQHAYNSPKTVFNLRHPVSPFAESPQPVAFSTPTENLEYQSNSSEDLSLMTQKLILSAESKENLLDELKKATSRNLSESNSEERNITTLNLMEDVENLRDQLSTCNIENCMLAEKNENLEKILEEKENIISQLTNVETTDMRSVECQTAKSKQLREERELSGEINARNSMDIYTSYRLSNRLRRIIMKCFILWILFIATVIIAFIVCVYMFLLTYFPKEHTNDNKSWSPFVVKLKRIGEPPV